ncbi:MAG: hypothetical protein H7A24_11440 [Leptospiraceae bacterium]|nr:hypothetical protein [Leptospiraceae bacterium]MCP5512487.1 hypothetical protein [Leptospiraceae bacterium]
MRHKVKPFESPDVFGAYQPAPGHLKRLVLSQVIPISYIKYISFSLFYLFLTPIILLLYVDPNLIGKDDLINPLLFTLTSLFVIFSILSGYILSTKKFPGLQGLKNIFGYTE